MPTERNQTQNEHLRQPTTGKRIWRALWDDRENAYTTITTTLHKMAKKGIATERKSGNVWLFSAALTEDEFIETRARPIVQALPAEVVAQLLAERREG